MARLTRAFERGAKRGDRRSEGQLPWDAFFSKRRVIAQEGRGSEGENRILTLLGVGCALLSTSRNRSVYI
jgi:hypothetical protein